MRLSEEQKEVLEKSYFGTLSNGEKAVLDKWLENDDFRKEAEAYLISFEKVDREVENELENTFRIWEKRAFGRQMINSSWMKIAVAIFLAVVIVFLVYLMQLFS